MNIAFVNSTHKWGGVKTWCLDMAMSLQEQENRVHIIGRPGPFIDKSRQLGIPATPHTFGNDFSPTSIAFFLAFLARHKTDVLVANVSKDLRTAGVAARIMGVPIVQHIGAPGDVVDRFKTRLTQWLLRPSIVACSEFTKERLVASVPLFSRYRVRAILPGTRPAPTPPSTNNSPRVIITTSQLNADKGHVDLIDALARLRRQGFDFRCVIVGTGNEEGRLRDMCDALDLGDVVRFTGFVTDVSSRLRRADIFVLPTFCEPLGIALEEAMSQGLVPIARNAGGPREIWHPEMREHLIPPEAGAEGFARALKTLLSMTDDSLLDLKRRTHHHASRTFSIDKQAREFYEWMTTLS